MYAPATSMMPGYGYWIYAYDDCEFWVENISADPNNYITHLNETWNSIGIPSVQTVNLTDIIVHYNDADYNWTEATTNANPTGGPIVDKNIFGWNRPGQNYQLKDILEPGYAYWMWAYYDCILKR